MLLRRITDLFPIISDIDEYAGRLCFPSFLTPRDETLASVDLRLRDLSRLCSRLRAEQLPADMPFHDQRDYVAALADIEADAKRMIEETAAQSAGLVPGVTEDEMATYNARALQLCQTLDTFRLRLEDSRRRLWQIAEELRICEAFTRPAQSGAASDQAAAGRHAEDTGERDGRETESPTAATPDEQPSRHDALIRQMEPAVRLAWLSYCYAEVKAAKRLEDREAYNLVNEEGIPEGAGDRGELSDYELPSFDTWSRYLRDARRLLGESKYTRRHGRPYGKSVVRQDENERPASDD
jgi:hypothetical protein